MMNRRALLKTLALGGTAATAMPGCLFAQTQPPAQPSWIDSIPRYLESHARSDGGYGWEDQQHGHLTPTFAVIGCYRVIKQLPPDPERVAAFVRSHHPGQLKKLEQDRRVFVLQQIRALTWLGSDVSEFRDQIRGWTRPSPYLKQYEQHGYPIFQSEVGAFSCRLLLGLPMESLSPHFTSYLDARRRSNGSFNNTPAAEGGDGHVLNTWWGLQALKAIGREKERRNETIEWLRRCQLPEGGFTWQPKHDFAGVDDLAYTWAAVRALDMLGSAPLQREACVAYLYSLINVDGGCSDRPGWLSNPMATYYALEALETLGALYSQSAIRPHASPPRQSLPPALKVFSIQIEAHGQGSPAEAVDLARSLRIHLWGGKNARPEWINRAQAIADTHRAPIRFFAANEEYGTWVNVPGLGTYSHTSDIIAPAGAAIGEPLASSGIVSWPAFRERRLAPLLKGNGRLIWQFGENEELVRLFLDDSLERGGYSAISTFHFGNPDFINSEPFLQRWRGQIPYVALQDAHGAQPWWFADMTTAFRTVFLGHEPTWEEWLRALRQNWVVSIRRDVWTGFKTWMHSGSREVLEFVREHESQWRWWDNPDIGRPMVSIVALRPSDEFEVARPERGIHLRVRCARENSTQGLPQKPLAELVRLLVDHKQVEPEAVTSKVPRGNAAADYYHLFRIPKPAPGKHVASAVVRVLADGIEVSRQIEFQA